MALHHHRRHHAWMSGGALALAAVTLFWYRKYSRRRRNLGGDDLIFGEDDDDDFDKEPDEELQRVFTEAAQVARSPSFPGSGGGRVLDDRDQLMLYGLYKQATEGDRNEDRGAVSFFDDIHHSCQFDDMPCRVTCVFWYGKPPAKLTSITKFVITSNISHPNSTLLHMQNTMHGVNSKGYRNDLPCKSIVKLCIILRTEVNLRSTTTAIIRVAILTIPILYMMMIAMVI